MGQHVFGHHAANDDALDDLTCSSCLGQLVVAQLVGGKLELITSAYAFRRDEVIVHSNNGDRRLRCRCSVLSSSPSTFDAEPAPRSKGVVVNAVSLDFSCVCW